MIATLLDFFPDHLDYIPWLVLIVMHFLFCIIFFLLNCSRLESYRQRKVGVDEVDTEMTRDLTPFEVKLLESQEVMMTRGKVFKSERFVHIC